MRAEERYSVWRWLPPAGVCGIVALDRSRECAHVKCARDELRRDRFLFARGLDEGGQNGIQSNRNPVFLTGSSGWQPVLRSKARSATPSDVAGFKGGRLAVSRSAFNQTPMAMLPLLLLLYMGSFYIFSGPPRQRANSNVIY